MKRSTKGSSRRRFVTQAVLEARADAVPRMRHVAWVAEVAAAAAEFEAENAQYYQTPPGFLGKIEPGLMSYYH